MLVGFFSSCCLPPELHPSSKNGLASFQTSPVALSQKSLRTSVLAGCCFLCRPTALEPGFSKECSDPRVPLGSFEFLWWSTFRLLLLFFFSSLCCHLSLCHPPLPIIFPPFLFSPCFLLVFKPIISFLCPLPYNTFFIFAVFCSSPCLAPPALRRSTRPPSSRPDFTPRSTFSPG